MATVLKRLSITLKPEWEPELTYLKKEYFFNRSCLTVAASIGQFIKIIAIPEVIYMENRTAIKIGKDTFYIGFAGVDRKTGEVMTGIMSRPLKQGREERTSRFAAAQGLVKKDAARVAT